MSEWTVAGLQGSLTMDRCALEEMNRQTRQPEDPGELPVPPAQFVPPAPPVPPVPPAQFVPSAPPGPPLPPVLLMPFVPPAPTVPPMPLMPPVAAMQPVPSVPPVPVPLMPPVAAVQPVPPVPLVPPAPPLPPMPPIASMQRVPPVPPALAMPPMPPNPPVPPATPIPGRPPPAHQVVPDSVYRNELRLAGDPASVAMLLGLAGPASLHAYRPQGRKLAERRAAVARSDPNVTNPNKESATNVPTAPVLEASTCTQQKENPGPSGKLPLHQVLPSDEENYIAKLQTPFVSTGPSNNISKQSEMNTEMGSSVTDTSAHSATSACKNPKCLVHTLLADREEPKVHATASTTNKEEQLSELPTDSMEQKGKDSSQVLSSDSTPNLEQEEKEKTLVIEPSTSTPSSNTSLAKIASSETPRVQNDRDLTTAASSNIAQNVESAPLVAFLMPPNYGSAVAKSKGKKKSSGRKLENPLASATRGYETPQRSISGTKNDQKTPSADSLLPQSQVPMADPSGNVSKTGKSKTESEPARKGLNPAVPSPVSNTPLADRLHSLIHQSASEFSADMTSVSQPSGRSKQKTGKKSKAFMKPAETAVSSELPVPSTSSGITASSSDRSLPQARHNESVVRAPLRTVSGGNILHAIDHARMNAPNRPLPPTLAAQRSQRGATPDVTRLISPGPAYARNAFEQSYINASRGTLVDDPNIARYAKRIKVQPYYFPVMQQAENPILSAWRNAQYNQPSTSTAAQTALPGPSQGGKRLYVHPAGDTSLNRNQTATPSPQESASGRATIQADGTFRYVPNAGFITPSAGRTSQTTGGTSHDTSSSGAARTLQTTGSTSSHTSHSGAKPQTTGGTSCNTASSGMSRLIANPTVGSNFAMSPPGTAPTTSQTAGRASYDISISGGTGTTLTTGGAISGDSSSKKISTTPQTTGGTRPSPPASGISGTMSQASAEASSAPLPTGGVRASRRGGGVSRSKNRASSEKEIPAGGSGSAGDAPVDDGRNREPPQALRGDTPQAEDTPGVKLEASSTGGNMQETSGEPLPNDLPDWVSPHLVNDYYRAMHLSTHLEGRNHFTRRRRDEKSPKCSEHFRGFWNINWAPLLQENATDANEAAVSSILAAKTQREPEASGADTSTTAASAAGTSATEAETQLEPEAPRADTPANVASAGGISASETAETPSKLEVPRADTSTNAAPAAGTSATEAAETQPKPEAPRADTSTNATAAAGTSATEAAEIQPKPEAPRAEHLVQRIMDIPLGESVSRLRNQHTERHVENEPGPPRSSSAAGFEDQIHNNEKKEEDEEEEV